MKTKMVIKKASMGGTSSGYTPSTAQNSNKVSCDAYSQNGGQIMQKGSKLKKQKIGGMVKKMAVGGTTTKRIIKKSTGGMYGIPQENLGTSSQYGFAKKGGATKKYQKGGSSNNDLKGVHAEPRVRMSGPLTEKDTKMIANMEIQGEWKGVPYAFPRSWKKYGRPDSQRRNFEDDLRSKMQKGGTTKADPYGVLSVLNKKFKIKGSNKSGGKTNMGPTKIVPKKVDPKAPKASKTRTIERNGTFEMKKGGATKATKFAALAPPYNKATFADRIVGAKKSAKKKK